jgi:hypothetical protein
VAGNCVIAGRRPRAGEIPKAQAAVVGANIRVLRQRNGWTQAKLGQLMGWRSNSTVCAAEGQRGGQQRGFTPGEVQQLADIFSLTPWQLTTRCANCDGHPPPGYTCQTCGSPGQPTAAQRPAPARSPVDEQ